MSRTKNVLDATRRLAGARGEVRKRERERENRERKGDRKRRDCFFECLMLPPPKRHFPSIPVVAAPLFHALSESPFFLGRIAHG